MDRRSFLMTTGAAALATTATGAIAQGNDAEARLNATFDAIFTRLLDESPELCTSLGVDKGARAVAKSRLDDDSAEGRARRLARTRAALEELGRFKDAPLSEAAKLNLEVVTYSLHRSSVPAARFDLDSVQRPYRIFQQGGAYFGTPDFLNTAHTISDAADCEAYLARLEAFADALDVDSKVQQDQAARGYLAPAWSLELTHAQMAKLRGQPAATASMVQSLVKRAAAKGIAGDWQARAAAIVGQKVYPALDRQMALVKSLTPGTADGDGIWRTPRGDEIYAAALADATTTAFTPDEVHRMGLEQVAEISAELDKILKGQGFTKGSVGARLAQLNVDPSQLYPDTAEGRAALIAGLNADYQALRPKLARAFNILPTTPLEIRAVPVEIQDGASNGYYNRASLDGSRPAIYFINLKNVGDWPKYSLPALTYHEADPGHHLQISTAQLSGDLPMLRKVGGFNAYSEGWALYAETVADELGGYDNPLERAGYLQSFLFRAARLVIDTGLHTKRWSRAQAVDYMVETTGFARPRSQREIERYCTQPGQACSYKVGHAAWVRARAQAEALLGKSFDIRDFHDILAEGPMPLSILERRVAERAQAKLARG